MIRIDHVSKSFGRFRAVRDVTLHVPEGDSVALWGGNGAGKSTLIRCVLGLLRCRGRVTVSDRDVRRYGKQARRLIGYVPQELGFYDDLRAGEALALFGRLKGLAPRDTRGAMERVGIGGHQRKRVRELSGGMKQRLALAIAMLGEPPVLVLDEVTASLDACGRAELVALLTTLRGAGRTMLFASHRVEEVAALARRVVVLHEGSIVSDTPACEFTDPGASHAALHLIIPAPIRPEAMRVLEGSGFRPQLNGVGIVVPVSGDRKAAPFRVLTEAGLRVDDFDIIADTTPPAAHEEVAP